jgi:hypothetical protein
LKVPLFAAISTSTPRAPLRSMPSSSGQATARSAALLARSGPPATAVPIIALPGSLITVRTSSKSTSHQPLDVDDVADAAHRVLQHVVGVREGLLLGHVVAHHFQQLLVEHDDQRAS